MSTAVVNLIEHIQEAGGLKGSDVANIFGVSPPTVSRWRNNKAEPPLDMQGLISDLRYVIDKLSEFYTPDEARLWLNAKHPLLQNRRAIDLIRENKMEDVLIVIDRLDNEAYI